MRALYTIDRANEKSPSVAEAKPSTLASAIMFGSAAAQSATAVPAENKLTDIDYKIVDASDLFIGTRKYSTSRSCCERCAAIMRTWMTTVA